jgi:hypothetical protein
MAEAGTCGERYRAASGKPRERVGKRDLVAALLDPRARPQAGEMPTPYDPAVIVKEADRLYSQASFVAITSSVLGFFAGPIVVGAIAAQIVKGEALMFAAFFGAILGALVGFAIGHARGHALRFQAQIGLCHLQTEFNTRGARQAAQPVAQPQGQWAR